VPHRSTHTAELPPAATKARSDSGQGDRGSRRLGSG